MCVNQALLQEAHMVEVKKKKQEDRIEKQLAFNREDRATQVMRRTISSAARF